VIGGKEVVDAVQAGKDGARDILEFLGLSPSEPVGLTRLDRNNE